MLLKHIYLVMMFSFLGISYSVALPSGIEEAVQALELGDNYSLVESYVQQLDTHEAPQLLALLNKSERCVDVFEANNTQ